MRSEEGEERRRVGLSGMRSVCCVSERPDVLATANFKKGRQGLPLHQGEKMINSYAMCEVQQTRQLPCCVPC
jgi:hypothetical protein